MERVPGWGKLLIRNGGAGVALAIAVITAALGGTRLIVPLFVAGTVAVAMAAAGGIALRMLVPLLGPQRAWPVSKLFIVGYPIFGTLCFAVGLRSTGTALLWTITLVLALFGIGMIVGRPRFDSVHDPVAPPGNVVDWAIATIALLTGVLFAQLPPFTLDELAYHLAAPRIWMLEGRITPLPLNSHSWFPFGVEGADLPLLALLGVDGAIASHFLHLFAAVAAFQLLRRELAPRVSSLYAPLLAFATTPALLVTAGWSWNEWPLVAICVLLVAELRNQSHRRSFGLVTLAIGAGMLTKYSFIPVAAVLVVTAFAVHRTERRMLTLSVLAGGLIGSFFLVRNLWLTGSAFYPFFSELAPEVSGYRRGESLLSTLQNYGFDRRFVDESLVIGLFLCVAVSIAFAGKVTSRFVQVAAVVSSLAGIAVLFVTTPSSRIVLPFFVPAVFAAAAVTESLSRAARATVTSTFRLAAILQLAIVVLYLQSFAPLAVLFRHESPAEFLQRSRRLYPQITWLNAAIPERSRTLVVGAQELFWFDRPVRGGGNFDGPRIASYLAEADPGKLKRDGFSHLALITDGVRIGASADVRRRERETVLDARSSASLTRLIGRDARLVARNGSAMLFELP